MATCYLRRILSTHSRSPLNVQGSETSTDLDFANRFLLKTNSCLNSSAPFDEATGHCKYARVLSCGYFGAPLLFKLLWGASSGPKGPPGRGNSSVLASSNSRSVATHNRCIFKQGLWRQGASHPVNMQSIWPSHGALNICSDSGLRPSWGLPRINSTLPHSLQTNFSS